MKRLVKVAAGGVALLVVGLGVAGYAMFGDLAPGADGHALEGVGFTIQDGYVSIGVLEAGGPRLVLVDAGNDPDGNALFAGLEAHGHHPDDVAAIFLTHGHPDHAAAVRLLPNAAVYAMQAEVPFALGERAYNGPLPHLMGPVATGARVTHPLQDGDVVRIGELDVECFLVPGHTAGSAAYLAGGALFLGDSASLTKSGALVGAPWLFSDDQTENASSLRGLAQRLQPRAATVKRLVTSHTGDAPGFTALGALLDE